MPLPLALAVAYGGYSALRLGSEWRYLNDYKKRYPWVKIRYPARTPRSRPLVVVCILLVVCITAVMGTP